MNLIFDIDEPDINTVVERVMKITKCPDKKMVRRMAQTVKDITEKCRETAITDGCCGMRELISWVQSYMIVGDVLKSAKYTVLPSVSSDPENREAVYTTCLLPKYAA